MVARADDAIWRPTVYLTAENDAALIAELERCGTRRRTGRFLFLVRLGLAAEQLAKSQSVNVIFGLRQQGLRPSASSLRVTLKLDARAQDLRTALRNRTNQSYCLREWATLGLRREAILTQPSATEHSATRPVEMQTNASSSATIGTVPSQQPVAVGDPDQQDRSLESMIAGLRSGL